MCENISTVCYKFRVSSFVSRLRLETIPQRSAYALAELRRVSSKKRYGLAIAQPTSLGQCRLGQPAFSVGNCVPEESWRAAFAERWRVAFDAVADKYGFTEAMRAAGWQSGIPCAACNARPANRTFGAEALSMSKLSRAVNPVVLEGEFL